MLLRKLTDSFHVEHPNDEDITEIFKELDVNGDRRISQTEFQALINDVVEIIKEERKWWMNII